MLYLVNSLWFQGLSVIYYCEGIFNIQSPQSIPSYYLGSIPVMYEEKQTKRNKMKSQIAGEAVTNTT